MKICPVVLAGGSGTRLWPFSRKSFPKQFLDNLFDNSLFSDTLSRASDLPFDSLPPIIVCNNEHKFLALNEINNTNRVFSKILLEPEGKNTAPAVTLAALYAEENFGEEVLMLVLPSDHKIDKNMEMFESIDRLRSYAESGSLCTIGINPTYPNTGYGYLELSGNYNRDQVSELISFHEKPSIAKAKEFISSGNFAWNSGIYLFSNQIFLSSIRKTHPSIFSSCTNVFSSKIDEKDFLSFQEDKFLEIPSDSIDFAVMEKSSKFEIQMHMTYLNSNWSDMGSWSSVLEAFEKDKNGNSTLGDVLSIESENSLLIGTDAALLAAIGLKNMLVVNSPDALLVASLDSEDSINKITKILKENDRKELLHHKKVSRPWGDYTVIEDKENYKVKNIRVAPHSSLSLQRHKHRSENWVIVSGKACVIKGEEEIELSESESIYIPANTIHSLINRQDEDLYIIEVQTGSYFGEDDIERLEDKYGRA